MKTAKIDFNEQQKAIEVRGKVYDIPPRTSKTENALQEWEKNRTAKTDYECYYTVFEILFGAEKRDELMENGEDENLDFLYKVCITALDLYNEEKNSLTAKNMQNFLKQISPLFDKVNSLASAASKIAK